ncbi:MAG: DMT family transporter, partial [Clostridiaceae bacterium]|nr:DMT family transporter [Clostridiaceae bacterium]
ITLVLIAVVQGLPLTGYGSSGIIVGLLLSIFSTILGHSIFSWCLKFLSPAFVSASKLCEPVVAALFAAVLFQEIPKPLQILGGAVIIGGVVYYSRLESR